MLVFNIFLKCLKTGESYIKYGILHLSYKYLSGGQVNLGERGLGQILSLNDHGSLHILIYFVLSLTPTLYKKIHDNVACFTYYPLYIIYIIVSIKMQHSILNQKMTAYTTDLL